MNLTKIGINYLLTDDSGQKKLSTKDAFQVVSFLNSQPNKRVNGTENLPDYYRNMIVSHESHAALLNID